MGFWSTVGDYVFGGAAGNDMPTTTKTGDEQRGYIRDMLGRQAPQMDASQSNQARGQQQNLAQMLQGVASGQQVGAGEMAVNRQANQANAAQNAQASMARGANAALAARSAARNQADIGTNAAGQAAQAQMQDASNAQGQLSGLLGTMRGQDIGVAGANQNAQMSQQNVQLAGLAQMLGIDQAELNAALGKAQVNGADKGMFGSLLQAGGQVGAAAVSDERTKEHVEDAGGAIDEMLAKIEPKTWKYIDEKHGKGTHVGVMAQALERSEVGRDLVFEHEGVKHIDIRRTVPVLLAAVARLEDRIRELEGR